MNCWKRRGNPCICYWLIGDQYKTSSMPKSKKVVIKVAEPSDHPLLVSFPLGVPEDASKMKVTVGRKGTEKNMKTMVVAEHNSLTYKGTDFGETSYKKNNFNYAVGVLSADGTLTLHPTNNVFVLRPKVENNQVPEDIAKITATERRDALTNEFGSKKRKRALAAEKSNIILAENISAAEELGNALSSTSNEQRADLIDAAEKIVAVSKRKSRGGK
jgi:hypothetical protein